MYKRKLAAVVISAFFVLFSSQTFAEEPTIELNDQDQQSITTQSTSELTSNEEALTQNAISLGADTGSNNVQNGTIIDNFDSGDISGQITAANCANSNLAPDSSIGVKTAEQDNKVDADDYNNMDNVFVIGNAGYPAENTNNQLLYVNNNEQINLDLNTGENNFEHNTLINSATTGDIDFATNLININNLNNPTLLATLNVYSILGDFVGDVVVEDSFLNEEPAVEIYDTDQIIENNITSETTDSQFNMNTGENEFASNSLVGPITSGDVAAGYFQNEFAGLLNKANFFILNVLGEWTGTNFLSGYENVIINTLDNTNTPAEVVAYENMDNNSTNVINQDTTYNVSANTGRNKFNQNTYVGRLDTGHINLLEYVLALKPNLQSLKNKLNIRVLNILGSWRGNLTKTAQATEPLPPVVPSPQPGSSVLPANNNTNGQPEDRESGQVLGVQDVAFDTQEISANDQVSNNFVLAESSINPGEIEAGPNVNNLLLLLLIIPALAFARMIKKS